MNTRYVLPLPLTGEDHFERDRRLFVSSMYQQEKRFYLLHADKTTKEFNLDKNQKTFSVSWELRLEQLNEMGTQVYMYLNPPGLVSAIAGEMGTFENWGDMLPSMIIQTALNTISPVWFTDDTPLQGLSQLQDGLKLKFKCKVYDLIPVPGFYIKSYLVHFLHYSGEIFTFRELTEAFPPRRAQL